MSLSLNKFFRGAVSIKPELKLPGPPNNVPVKKEVLSPMQEIIRQARQDLGERAHPEEVAAYFQASATLALTQEMREIRTLLESGAAGLTVGIEK
jgi:hypothetical protein